MGRGKGLVYLASRSATFRLQFLQWLLSGPKDTLWKPLSHSILKYLNGPGQDLNHLLMNTSEISASPQPCYYKCVFKMWIMLKKEGGRRNQCTGSWISQSYGGPCWTFPAGGGKTMVRKMVTAEFVTLGQVVVLTGPWMDDPSDLAAWLGLCSKRTVQKLLDHWKNKLSCMITCSWPHPQPWW